MLNYLLLKGPDYVHTVNASSQNVNYAASIREKLALDALAILGVVNRTADSAAAAPTFSYQLSKNFLNAGEHVSA